MKKSSIPAVFAAIIALCTAQAVAQDAAKAKDKSGISYAKDIAPVLEKFCAGCHNADEEHPSELYMESYESLMKGGKHGVSIKPGSSKESLLMQKMSKEPPFGKVMPPPRKKTPTPEQVELIRAWIEQGAKKN